MKDHTAAGHIRRLHRVDEVDGLLFPAVEENSAMAALVETRGYEELRPVRGWYQFNYLIESEGRTYLAAIY